MKKGDLKIDDNTVVYCETREIAVRVSVIVNGLGYYLENGMSYRHSATFGVYYNFHKGTYMYKENCKDDGLKIITGEEFLKLHGHTFVAEPKIGETIELGNGENVTVLKNPNPHHDRCNGCYLYGRCFSMDCNGDYRTDDTDVYFKLVEKE